jgi:uncharacterized protein YecE (DUF72 family)
MPEARLYAGTSGYSYSGWKGGFYPRDLPQARFLEFYSRQLPTVEVNNTFYRFPAAKLFEGWREETPDDFLFAVKANQRITHKGRLKDVTEVTHDFIDRSRLLGARLGPILFQLPPFLRRDDERLEGFVGALLPGTRYALEFRHESWHDEKVFRILRDAGVALVIAEREKIATPKVVTAGFSYLRLHREEYTRGELDQWRAWMRAEVQAGRDVFAYVKHDEAGVAAERAAHLLGPGGGRSHEVMKS